MVERADRLVGSSGSDERDRAELGGARPNVGVGAVLSATWLRSSAGFLSPPLSTSGWIEPTT
jgi:hypothetical protein